MKKVSLSGSPRANVGKKDAKSVRREGLVPCVLYGGEKQFHFNISHNEAKKLVYTPDVFQVDLTVEGNNYSAIVQEVQRHPVTDVILHLDFLLLSDSKEVTVKLPVRLKGASIGVRNGGNLSTPFRKLAMRGLPTAIPEAVELDITNLKIGDGIRVRDINQEGVRFLDPEGAVVVAVKMARKAIVVDEDGAAPAEDGADAPAEDGADAPAAE